MEIEGEKQANTLILRGNHTALADTGDVRDKEREADRKEPGALSPASQQVEANEALS